MPRMRQSTPVQPYFPIWKKQADFLDSKAPTKALVAGVGAGKSFIGALDLLQRVRPGRLYMVTGPTYKILHDATFRSFQEVFGKAGRIVKVLRGESFCAFVRCQEGGNAEILFRSTDEPDRLRGPNISGIWMDEASGSSYQAYQILVQRLREKGDSGWITATFTPKGLAHWTYKVFGTSRKGVDVVFARTDENPFLSPEYIERVHQDHAGLFADQELGGCFVAIEGAEWPPEHFERPDFWFDDWPHPAEVVLTVISLDPSKGRDSRVAKPEKGRESDFSAFVWAQLVKSGKVFVDADLDNRRDATQIARVGVELLARLKPNAFAVETNQFQFLLANDMIRIAKEKGMEMPLPIWGVNNTEDKTIRIRSLSHHLALGDFRFHRNSHGAETLVQQLRDWPQGQNDDGPDSLEVCVRMLKWLLRNRRPEQPKPSDPTPLGMPFGFT